MSDAFFGVAILAITVLGAVVLVRGWYKYVELMDRQKRRPAPKDEPPGAA